MKKLLLIVAVMMVSLAAQAQEMYLGGGISLWRNTDIDKTSFSITPDFGYVMNETWAFGGEVAYSHSSVDEGLSINSFAIAPYARYSYFQNKIVRLFLDLGFGVSTSKVKHAESETGFEIGIKPGLAIKLDHHFSLVTKVGFAGYRDDFHGHAGKGFGVDLNGEHVSFGVEYEF